MAKRKSGEDFIILAAIAILVWIGSKARGAPRVVITLVLVAGIAVSLATKPWFAAFLVIGLAFMWREKLPNGLYLRRAVSIGPVRLNASKSGLGGSVGVKGARVGRRPDGSMYVHGGRGGVYGRKELSPRNREGEPGRGISEE